MIEIQEKSKVATLEELENKKPKVADTLEELDLKKSKVATFEEIEQKFKEININLSIIEKFRGIPKEKREFLKIDMKTDPDIIKNEKLIQEKYEKEAVQEINEIYMVHNTSSFFLLPSLPPSLPPPLLYSLFFLITKILLSTFII